MSTKFGSKQDCYKIFPVEEAGRHFDNIADCIIRKDYAIKKIPDKKRYARNVILNSIAEFKEGNR